MRRSHGEMMTSAMITVTDGTEMIEVLKGDPGLAVTSPRKIGTTGELLLMKVTTLIQ